MWRASVGGRNVSSSFFKLAVVVPAYGGLLWAVMTHSSWIWHPAVLLWTVAVAAVELLPVPVWRGVELGLGFPILLAVAILYPPVVAAAVAFVGAFDAKELRGEVRPLTALFNRAQIMLSVYAAGVVFHSIASIHSPWYVLIPAVALATLTDYGANHAMVACYMAAILRVSLREVFTGTGLAGSLGFLTSYVGLGFVGLVVARLSVSGAGYWSVVAFILPLAFARQMFFRTRALEEAHKELKDRERVLRALSNRMAEERLDERMQIAGYLHDDLAQVLFRLNLQVEMARKRLRQNDVDAALRDLEGIEGTKKQASDMVRAMIRDLHRSPIGRKGLAEALHSFAMDANIGSESRVLARVDEVSLPPPIQLLIYQIAREAAMNALKHAEAEHVWITLRDSGEDVVLEIRDDGKGFDPSAPAPDGHFGAIMMRERAQVAGGSFAVSSEPGRGSTVRATFPRVWVEEGSRLESEGAAVQEAPRAPVGTTTSAYSARLGWLRRVTAVPGGAAANGAAASPVSNGATANGAGPTGALVDVEGVVPAEAVQVPAAAGVASDE
jgi:signal transduction histidine kinase